MKNNNKKLAISILLALSGCSDDNAETVIPESDRNLEEVTTVTPIVRPIGELETLTPVIRPIGELETLTPVIRPIGELETLTPLVKLNFDIPSSNIIDIAFIEREYTKPFTLDDVSVSYDSTDDNYTIVNETARFIGNPTLLIDGLLFRLETTLEPFQRQTFLFNTHTNEPARSIEYVEEQPYFRSFVNGYLDMPNNPEFHLPTAEQAYRYEQEIRGHKNATNDFSFTSHFADYISSYGTKTARSSLMDNFDTIDCPYDHEHPIARSGKDDSDPNQKILSYLNHEPRAAHYMTTKPGYAGYATIGHGWLSVADWRLYKEGQTQPQRTYLHEKGHNHGFGHNGGMTYGLPELLMSFMTDTGTLSDYYNGEALAQTIPRAIVMDKHHFDGNYINTQFTFAAPTEVNENISRFMLILPDGIEDDITVSAVVDGVEKALEPTKVYANQKVLVFETGFEVPISIFSDQQDSVVNYINVRMPSPTNAQSYSVFASGVEKNWSLQANKSIELNAGTSGLYTNDGQFVFYHNDNAFNENGIMEETLMEYTPEEAQQLCVDMNFSGLGILQPYKSQEQMDFQMLYLGYKSQVGIDPDTLEPVAVSVNSSYKSEHTNYADKGSLIVCK